MADKKEVLDYLRNQQKSAEIDAKVNGINSWVLLGAMAVIAWHLLGTAESQVWSEHELLARVLVAVQGILFAVRTFGVGGPQEDSVRFSSWRLKDMDAPYLDIVNGIVLLIPVGFLITSHKDYTVLLIGVAGFIFFLSGCLALIRLIRGDDLESERFPEPSFGNSQRTNFFLSLFFMLAWIFSAAHQVQIAIDLLQKPIIDNAKTLAALAALYALLLLAIQRRGFSESKRWTYVLETELLLENVTPDVAIRRIEHRALGRKLQDVMDRFFDELDQKFTLLESSQDECLNRLKEASSVPKEYAAERNARVNSATENFNKILNSIANDCQELATYLDRLKTKNNMEKRPIIENHIKVIETRKLATYERLAEWQKWIDRSKRELLGE